MSDVTRWDSLTVTRQSKRRSISRTAYSGVGASYAGENGTGAYSLCMRRIARGAAPLVEERCAGAGEVVVIVRRPRKRSQSLSRIVVGILY